MTSVAGYIGWVPGKDAPTQPAAPTDEDIQGLYKDLDFDPQAHENLSRPAGSAFGIKAYVRVSMPSCHNTLSLPGASVCAVTASLMGNSDDRPGRGLSECSAEAGWEECHRSILEMCLLSTERGLHIQVNAAVLTLSEDICLPELADQAKVLSLELDDLEAEASLLDGQLSSDISAADIMAHDMSSLYLGTSDTIVSRWNEGEKFHPANQQICAFLVFELLGR